jgi:hypothetical protein
VASGAQKVPMRLQTFRVNIEVHLKFEVFTAVTMKNGAFWDVTQCGYYKNRVSEDGGAKFLLNVGSCKSHTT